MSKTDKVTISVTENVTRPVTKIVPYFFTSYFSWSPLSPWPGQFPTFPLGY